jgi:2',3'-cyclic-nucleotide 2'-phosphodiesterase (5'-nucleotidase family)
MVVKHVSPSTQYEPPTGVGRDPSGGPLIDPTKNVLDLVRAESKYQDAMRDVEAQKTEALAQAENRLQTALRAAESLRIDQLAQLRQEYDKRIADMLSESVKSTSSLVSSQLIQIQSTFDTRLTRLEQYQLLSTGRSQVADPALADALASMALSIKTLGSAGGVAMGKAMGRGEIVAYIAMGVLVMANIVGIAAFFIARTHT